MLFLDFPESVVGSRRIQSIVGVASNCAYYDLTKMSLKGFVAFLRSGSEIEEMQVEESGSNNIEK